MTALDAIASKLNGKTVGVVLASMLLIQAVGIGLTAVVWYRQNTRDEVYRFIRDVMPDLRDLVTDLRDRGKDLGDVANVMAKNSEAIKAVRDRVDTLEQLEVRRRARVNKGQPAP